jgi:hypothetical protein
MAKHTHKDSKREQKQNMLKDMKQVNIFTSYTKTCQRRQFSQHLIRDLLLITRLECRTNDEEVGDFKVHAVHVLYIFYL